MRTFLIVVSVTAYVIAIFAFFGGLAHSDMQIVLAGVFATCGTVAFVGAAVIERLEWLGAQPPMLQPAVPTLSGGPESERRAIRPLIT